ncbi:hypothetical protein DPMN_126798 [Dreissena polymorpha]|uniref:Uncharacterized protein n=1 Tax=Dreissena polymorpha TaxID=45954 RepID=A0A9D4H022_DREPO|nr:hypothetical protein DPMN_126798 [Dreissena polymorpha]
MQLWSGTPVCCPVYRGDCSLNRSMFRRRIHSGGGKCDDPTPCPQRSPSAVVR